MEKFWYKCGTTADDGFESPMELTMSEAITISDFLKQLESKNKWAKYCGNTWIDITKWYITEEECWNCCHNEPYASSDDE